MTDTNNAFKVKHGLIATTATIDALILNGSSPITDVAQLTGPQGDPGPQGEQGIQGEQGDPGSPGVGVPTGGTAGQVLSKIDETDYNTQWVDQSGGSTNTFTTIIVNDITLSTSTVGRLDFKYSKTVATDNGYDITANTLTLINFETFVSEAWSIRDSSGSTVILDAVNSDVIGVTGVTQNTSNTQFGNNTGDFGSGNTGFAGGGTVANLILGNDRTQIDAIGSGPFTTDTWIYLPSDRQVSGFEGLYSQNNTGDMVMGVNGSPGSKKLTWYNRGATTYYDGATNIPQDEWVHIAIMRDSSSNVYYAINGVTESLGTLGWTYNFDGPDYDSIVGANLWGSSINGLLQNFRFSNAVIFDTAGFTPPAPGESVTTVEPASLSIESITFGDSSVQTTAYTGQNTIPLITAAETTATTTATGKLVSISDNGGRLAYYNNTVTNWCYVATDAVVYTPPAPPSPSGPPVEDYSAWYDVSSFSGSTWSDLSDNNYDATATGSPSVISQSGSGGGTFDAIAGTTSDSMLWPTNMTAEFTVFNVARYNGAAKQRILHLYQPGAWGWLFGHHENKSGVAFHYGAITEWTDHFGSNWVISVNQNSPNLYHGNGVNYALTGSTTGGSSAPLNINKKEDELSDWAIAEVIVYDRTLDSSEIASVEAYLAAKYGITI